MSDTIILTELPRELRAITGKRATYQSLYRMLTNGYLPGERTPAGRWFVRRQDLPTILRVLELSVIKETA